MSDSLKCRQNNSSIKTEKKITIETGKPERSNFAKKHTFPLLQDSNDGFSVDSRSGK